MKHLTKTLYVLVISIITVGCLNNFTPVKIEGSGMLPNLKNGERVLVEKNFGAIKRGDVIFFKYPKDTTKLYFKRVIGLPNETISIREGQVFVDDKKLDEPYLDQSYNQQTENFSPLKISDGSYFVLGDNRDNSADSRAWGTVQEQLIVGKHYLTY